jgi:glycopeptide antibiotics resistance protein
VRLYIFGGLILLVLGGFALAAAHAGRRAGGSNRALTNVALAAAFAAIVVVTLLPSNGEHEVRLRPFAEILLAVTPPFHRGWIAEITGNVLLFVPLGAVLYLRHVGPLRTVLVALALSISVELVQLVLPGRTTAIDDVLCNVAGAVLGWAAAWCVHGPSHAAAADDFRPAGRSDL